MPPSSKISPAPARLAGEDGHSAVELPASFNQLMIELADTMGSTLDLDTLLPRVAELVRRVIDYKIFAIQLLNPSTRDLRMRYQIGHTPEVEKLRVRVGEGISGQAAQRAEAVLVNDVTREKNYINAHPAVRSELAIPMIARGKVIGVIDIQSDQKDFFTEEHARLLALVASRVALAVENARLYTRVFRQAQTLEVLNEISRDLTSILNLDQLLRRIGDLLTRLIDYQMFSILLLDATETKLQHRFSVRFKENIHLKHDIPLDRGLVGAAATEKRSILVPDVTKDERYIELNPETRSELCVPLLYKDKVIGVLDLEHTRRNYFTDFHERTVTTLAAQVAIAIENARLYERIAREEQRLERDLAMAREVQMHLLPPCCPSLPNAELAVRFTPARQIGGDLYDFITYAGGRYAIAVGDVSGKGAPAALFAALVAGIMRSVAAVEPMPAEMLAAINTSLNERRIEAQFVSMLYAVWDEADRGVHVSNSGQPRPIHCRNGRSHMVNATGIPLGLFEDTEYDELIINCDPGDVVVLFSDGITDAQNAHGDQFGRKGVEDVLALAFNRSAEEIVDAIISAVEEHSAGVRRFDDETVVVLKVKSGDSAQPVRRPRKHAHSRP